MTEKPGDISAHWISVTERLPPVGRMNLVDVWDSVTESRVANVYLGSDEHGSAWLDSKSCAHMSLVVTHWMPIPKGPDAAERIAAENARKAATLDALVPQLRELAKKLDTCEVYSDGGTPYICEQAAETLNDWLELYDHPGD